MTPITTSADGSIPTKLTFLELVNACDNFRLPSNDSSTHAGDYLASWTLTQAPDSPVIGLLKPEIVDLLRKEVDGSWIIPLKDSVPHSSYRVSFHPSIDTPAKRTKVMKKLCERWRDSGTIYQNVIGPKKWRNEIYPVYRNPFGVHRAHDPNAAEDSDNGNCAFEMERSACPLFGVVAYGVHMTIYQENPDGTDLKIWVPTRSQTKQTWPGYLDNSVAGGIPSGMSAFESLVKEATEEASIDEAITKALARCTGSISYYTQTTEGWLKPEVQFVYDMKIPDGMIFQPEPSDGEVESFDLLPLDVVIDKMQQGRFKANCAAVLVDFLVRHGYLTPDNDPNYMEIMTRLHGRFYYDRWRCT